MQLPWQFALGKIRRAILKEMGDGGRVIRSTRRNWASATFTGLRFVISVRGPNQMEPDEIERLQLLEVEFSKFLVADICVANHESTGHMWLTQFEVLLMDSTSRVT